MSVHWLSAFFHHIAIHSKITSASRRVSGFVQAKFTGGRKGEQNAPGCAKGFKPYGAVVAVGWSKYF